MSGFKTSTLQGMADIYIALYAGQKRELMQTSSKGAATVPAMQTSRSLLVVGSPVVLEICIFHGSISHDAGTLVQL